MLDFDWSILEQSLPLLQKGILVTLKITITSIILGMVLGTLLAVARISIYAPLRWLAAAYVNCFRSIPLVMVLLWFYLIVPQFLTKFLNLSPLTDIRLVSAMVAFTAFEAAYYSQAFRVMTPLLLTQGVILFQDTALVYIIGLADFFRTATNIGKTTGYEIEMVLFAGAGYFVVCFCVSLAVTVVKKRLKL